MNTTTCPAPSIRVRALACVLPLYASACLIPLGDAETGEMRVGWSFPEDASCADVGVDTVTVQLVGADRGAGVEVDCVEGSTLIEGLLPADYDILMDAIGTSAHYSGREQLTVEAGFTSDEGIVALRPTLGPEGAALSVAWSFDGQPSCASAGVDEIDVSVRANDALVAARTFRCEDGAATLGGLPEGSATVELSARAGPVVRYAASTTATLGVRTAALGVLDLLPVLASLDVAWSFDGDPRCEVAGVDVVSVQVIDDDGATVAGASADCLQGRVSFTSLPPQHLTFVLEGTRLDARAWQNAVALTLTPGANPTITVSMQRTFATAHVRWLFVDAAGTGDCAAVNVASVTLQVFDPNGDAVTGGSFACAVGAATFTNLQPGAYRFVADAYASNGALVAQDTTGSPRGVTQTLDLGDNDVDVTLE